MLSNHQHCAGSSTGVHHDTSSCDESLDEEREGSINHEYDNNRRTTSEHRLDTDIASDTNKQIAVVRLCCCNVTFRQAKNITNFVSLIVIFGILLFVGGLSWYIFKSKDEGENEDEYLASPWVWPVGNITVGAYYYPWYGTDFHRGEGYVRKELSTMQMPELGEYNDSDPDTIYQHFKWSAQANIRLWVTSWWGNGTREDVTTKDVILQHKMLGDHQIALFYETTGRIKESEGYSIHRVIPDIQYICSNYFDHPNYYRIDERPVLFVYLTRLLAGLDILDRVIEDMRLAAQEVGYDIYIVGDHVFQNAPDVDNLHPPLTILDAVTNYDIYGSMFQPSPYATEVGVRQHFQRVEAWKELASKQDCAFIPSVSPGYNDLGVRPEAHHGPLSRQLSADDPPGSLFQTSLQYARKLVDPAVGNLIMVNSFNEWHEDTQIEPAKGESTNLPEELTHGIEYHGYGEHYLNILRVETLEL